MAGFAESFNTTLPLSHWAQPLIPKPPALIVGGSGLPLIFSRQSQTLPAGAASWGAAVVLVSFVGSATRKGASAIELSGKHCSAASGILMGTGHTEGIVIDYMRMKMDTTSIYCDSFSKRLREVEPAHSLAK